MSNWLNSHQVLQQFYRTQISILSTFTSPSNQDRSPKLILSANSGFSQAEAIYTLSLNQNIIIGRNLEHQKNSNQIQVSLPMYKKVGGRHAEICSVIDFNSNTPFWQICDLNSKNGTYINGQRIKGCQVLKSGDKITLGYAVNENAPEFIFEGQIQSSTQGSSATQSIDGDLVCLVISPKQDLSNSEKQLIEQVSKANIAGFIIILDNSGISAEDNQQVRARLSSIESLLQNQYSRLAEVLEIIALPLHLFYPNIAPAPIAPPIQQLFSDFSENLIDLAKTQGGRILIERANRQLQSQIQRIDRVLSDEQEALIKEMQRTELTMQGYNVESLRDRFTRVIKQVSEEREYFFQQARNEFNRTSSDFVSDIIPNNLIQKTEDYVRNLEPIVKKINGQVTIELQASNRDNLYEAILAFIRLELIQWSDRQWKYILHSLHSNGLEGLLQTSYTQLNCLPNFQMDNTFHKVPSKIEIANSLNVSFTDLTVDISYNESSGDAFNGIARIALMTTSAAFSISVGHPQAIIQGANVISALSAMVGTSVNRTQQQQLRIEQVVDSLKRNTYIHYQKIARYLLGRASQEIILAINREESLFRKSLEGIDEQFRGYYLEFKTISDGYKGRQQALDRDRQAFEQIKRLGG
jgi:FHA domain